MVAILETQLASLSNFPCQQLLIVTVGTAYNSYNFYPFEKRSDVPYFSPSGWHLFVSIRKGTITSFEQVAIDVFLLFIGMVDQFAVVSIVFPCLTVRRLQAHISKLKVEEERCVTTPITARKFGLFKF